MEFDYQPAVIVAAAAAIMMYATAMVMAVIKNQQNRIARKRAWVEEQQLREMYQRQLWELE
jgi:hypothetical protein